MAKASKHLNGGDILRFLQSFEGAAATFGAHDERWTLWLPEMTLGDRPLTPASQVFFPVILRHGQQAIAIRFLYDCSTGKVRYYTSAIPGEIASLPEFENAVSELFRHSLPVEPMRERKLARDFSPAPRRLDPRRRSSLAEPDAAPAVIVPAVAPVPAVGEPPSLALDAAARKSEVPAAPVEIQRKVWFEIGPRVRGVLMFLIFACAIVALSMLGIYVYLEATQDPGVLHHRMELEQMRLQQGR